VPRSRLLLVVALALPACAAFQTAAATVDGRTIAEARFVRQLDFVLADPRFGQQFPGPQGVAQRKVEARNLLTFLIHQQVVEAYATEHGIDVSQEEIDQQVAALTSQLGGEQAYQAQIRTSGATRPDIEDLLRHQLLRQKVAEAVVAERVSDEQLMQTYQERLPEFTQVRVSHILVRDRAEAQDLVERATPRNFARLAQKFSRDPSSASQGGDLGVQRPADLVQPFGQATLDIPVGQIGGPVETEFGFHVVYVREREARPFEEVRPELLEEVRGQVFTDWLLGRLDEAEVRVNPRYGYFEQTTGQVVERTATSPEPAVQVEP
jgi:foldase protein PrsA